jgi:hypothetical protein
MLNPRAKGCKSGSAHDATTTDDTNTNTDGVFHGHAHACSTPHYDVELACKSSEFVLYPRGDSPGTSRLSDGMQFG